METCKPIMIATMITPEIVNHSLYWSKVEKRELTNECWLWRGQVNQGGYGVLTSLGGQGKRRHLKAHRIAWVLCYGQIPQGMDVLHTCDTPPCVNPSHLFLGTDADNMADKVRKGRQSRIFGTKHPKAKITDEIARLIKIALHSGSIKIIDIAQTYNVSRGTVGHIKSNRTWRHVTI